MLPRFKHILVPLDFTPKNQTALDIAFEIAEVNSARVTLLHVVERFEESAEDDDTAEFYRRMEQRADAELELRAQRFIEASLDTEYKLRTGKRAAEIIQFADQRDVDLIILSSHRIDPAEPVRSLISLSYQVSILSPCPVMLVK